MFNYFANFYDRFMLTFFASAYQEVYNNMDFDKGIKILDVGGGTGILGKIVKKYNSEIDFYILDKNKSMLSKANVKGLSNLLRGNSSKLPFKSESFDYVICTDALHHFENKIKSLNEMLRVLNEEGRLILSDFTPESIVTKIICKVERMLDEPTYFHHPHSISKHLNKKNFITDIKWLNNFQYILNANRTNIS